MTQKEKNRRMMAERGILMEYHKKSGRDLADVRQMYQDLDCKKEFLPDWAEIMTADGPTAAKKEIQATEPTAAGAESVESIEGEVLEDIPPDELPPWVIDKIYELLENFKSIYGIEDLSKCAGVQWRAACQFVGRYFKRSDVIRDLDKQKARGQKAYNADRINALMEVWAELCGAFNHPPLTGDFMDFVGVSDGYFYSDGVTSSGVKLLKKAQKIEERGLKSATADHRQNPVGRMFLLKSCHGYREATEVVHTTETKTITATELPRLGTSDR